MDEPKYKAEDIINYIIEHENKKNPVKIKIIRFINDCDDSNVLCPRYEYEYASSPGVTFIALKSQIENNSQIEDNSQTGGRKTRRNKLRKKRRKTNRRKTNRRKTNRRR